MNDAGRQLWTENLLSVWYRYSHHGVDDLPAPKGFGIDMVQQYVYTAPAVIQGFSTDAPEFDPEDEHHARNLARCYHYQTCEHPTWETSWSKALIEKILVAIPVDEAREDRAPWSI
jgi:hypothetical protein